MPRSFQRRRGKPRLELQQDNANLPQESQQPTKSRLSKIKISKEAAQKDKDNGLTDKELEERMWKHVSVSKENPIAAPLHRSEFAVRFPQTRESYIRTVFAKVLFISFLYIAYLFICFFLLFQSILFILAQSF